MFVDRLELLVSLARDSVHGVDYTRREFPSRARIISGSSTLELKAIIRSERWLT